LGTSPDDSASRRTGSTVLTPEEGERTVKTLFISQHGQEELEAFTTRVNEELQRLGPTVKDVRMSTCLHEKSLGGRVSIPTVLFALMVMYEEPA
jgi:hypothetical protein